jgi:hypothetical protein
MWPGQLPGNWFSQGLSGWRPFLFFLLSFNLAALPVNGTTGSAVYRESGTELPELIRERLEHLNIHYPQEKLYLHTDKSHYVLRETLFPGYLRWLQSRPQT